MPTEFLNGWTRWHWRNRPLLCRLGIHRPHVAKPPYGSVIAGRYDRSCNRCPYWWRSMP